MRFCFRFPLPADLEQCWLFWTPYSTPISAAPSSKASFLWRRKGSLVSEFSCSLSDLRGSELAAACSLLLVGGKWGGPPFLLYFVPHPSSGSWADPPTSALRRVLLESGREDLGRVAETRVQRLCLGKAFASQKSSEGVC